MELTPRKKIILSEIVKAHIALGEPVGSKLLAQSTNLGLSSATLRNEMSDLCEMGFLEQPHTSAGRVPTAAGYRLYVTGLLGNENLSEPMKTSIDNVIERVAKDPENITSLAGQALSDLTGFPAVSLTIPEAGAYVKRVELLPMGRRSALLVLLTSDGVARSRMCRTAEDLNRSALAIFDRLVATDVIGASLSDFTGGFLQNIVAKAGSFAITLLPLFSLLFEMIDNVCQSQLDLKGEGNIYAHYNKESDARRIVEFISRRDTILSILSEIPDPVSVVFGDESGIDALKPSSMVVAKFGGGENRVGRIGVIGPTRMAYEELIPSISYFAKQLGKVLEQSLHDLDD
ncbi:MAG: heat-inducible transcription repressor HrcA [Clostridia bacterium]|nr:heat-inducible transcription repressor HrcA [Clostridia bacterium]